MDDRVCLRFIVYGHTMKLATRRELEIFCDALEVPDGKRRQGFLDGACRGNRRLRDRIEFLLATQPAIDQFFDEIARTFEPISSAIQTNSVGQPDTDGPVPNAQTTSRH